MVKLPWCSVTFKIRCALAEGRMSDAEHIAIEYLEAGYHSQPFLNLVAEILKTKRGKRKRGQPRKKI